jgi:quercetin dioxygenase-like cupin family protein
VEKRIYRTRVEEVPSKKTPSGATVWWLIKAEDGAPGFELRYFEVQPGKGTSGKPHPFEHEVFVLRGRGEIRGDGEEVIAIREGDAILIPPDARHAIENTGDGVLGFLCAIPNGKEDSIK